MSRYLFQANYVNAGVKGLLAEGGTPRREAAAAAIESVGGTLESFDFAFGDTDALGVADFPDAASAAALSLIINASGAVTIKLTPLLTPEDLDVGGKEVPVVPPTGRLTARGLTRDRWDRTGILGGCVASSSSGSCWGS